MPAHHDGTQAATDAQPGYVPAGLDVSPVRGRHRLWRRAGAARELDRRIQAEAFVHQLTKPIQMRKTLPPHPCNAARLLLIRRVRLYSVLWL